MSQDNVVAFPGESTADALPDSVLAMAAEASLTELVVIGWRPDGSLFFASSTGDPSSVLWLLHNGEHELLETVRE